MRIRFSAVALASLCLVGFAAATRAQNTISVPTNPLYSSTGLGEGGGRPFFQASLTNDPDPAEYTGHIEDIQPASYFELKFTSTTAGMYSVSMVFFQPSDPNTVLAFETYPLAGAADPTVTRYATPDSKDYLQFGTWGSAGVPRLYSNMDPVVAADGTTALVVPVVIGDNIIRVQNVTNRHFPADAYPITGQSLADPNLRSAAVPAARWSNLHIAGITLKRVGDLPAMGTITGTVTGDQPAGIPAGSALVVANDTGKLPVEITRWWKSGWYTSTKADGTYTLQAPAGAKDVKASRPSSYLPTGSPIASVTVPAGGSVTANMTMPSIWYKDFSGDWVANPQAEYLDSKNDNMAMQCGVGQNSLRLGWTWAVRKASLIVDVPVAGNYEFTDSYTSGDNAPQTMRLSSSLGPYTDVDQTANGWETLTSSTAPSSIYLAQGTQTLTLGLLMGNCDFDGFQLRQLHTPVTVGMVQGTITNALNGLPVAGATVTFAGATVTTDALGKYQGIGNAGTMQVFTVTAPNIDVPFSAFVDVVSGGSTIKDAQIAIRPSLALTTANGYAWKVFPNVGSAVDLSAEVADETGALAIDVPSNWDGLATAVNNMDSVTGWYRLHFTVPAGFLTTLPNRYVVFQCGGIDDIDATYLNGTKIGETGQFPTSVIPVRPAGYSEAATATLARAYEPGTINAWAIPRNYYFPASMLHAGDNVIAVKVYDDVAGGGITSTPSLVKAPAAGVVSGTVTAAGVGVAGVRVTAMDANAVSSAWALTDASGNYTLVGVNAGPVILGVAKPGYSAVSLSIGNLGDGASMVGVNVAVTAIAGGIAPNLDDFTDTNWAAKWDAVCQENAANAPFVTIPGRNINDSTTIPGSVTLDGGATPRGALISKARFSKFAAVMAARLVSAQPAVPDITGTTPNAIFQLYAPTTDDPTLYTFGNNLELDIEGYGSVNGEQRVNYMIFTNPGGNYTVVPVPFSLSSLSMVTPANPLDYAIARTGTFYDFYLNGYRVFSANFPWLSGQGNQKIALYSYPALAGEALTWDWAQGGPLPNSGVVKGDVNANGFLDAGDVVNALRIAAGLATSTTAEVAAGNVTGGGKVNVQDAVRLLQGVNGKAL